MDKHDVTGAKALVRLLSRKGFCWYRAHTRSRSWSQTFRVIGDTFSIYQTEDAIDRAFLPDALGSTTLKGEIGDPHILLEPPTSNRHIVCLLGISWTLNDAAMRMTLYLHMFGESQIDGVKAWHRGYRLELPHRGSAHAYTHVQPLKRRGWAARTTIPFADLSVPDTFPSFPLRGHNLTTLCAALAVSLHGVGVLRDIVYELRGNQVLQDQVKHLLD